jgi:hypothetical protein
MGEVYWKQSRKDSQLAMYKKSEKLRMIRKGLENAQCLGVAITNAGIKSDYTVLLWRKRPMIERYIQKCISKSDDRRNNAVVDSLFKQAINGNPTCIAIYLKFHMGWKDNPSFVNEIHNANITVTGQEKERQDALVSRLDKLLKD